MINIAESGKGTGIHKPEFILSTLKIIPLVLLIGLLESCNVVKIQENERGVRLERFNGGLNPDVIYGPGVHVFPIWDKGIIYNVGTFAHEEHLYFTTADDIRYNVNLELKYQVVPDMIGYLEINIGRDYYNLVIVEEVSQAFLNHFSNLTSDSILVIDIEELRAEMLKTISKPIRKNYIEMIDIKIFDITKLE